MTQTSSRQPLEIQNLPRQCHETLILALLNGRPRHGYELALRLEQSSDGHFRLNHGTLYPILHRLERDGLISGDWLEEGTKRKRKSYALSTTGRRHLEDQIKAWREFFKRFFTVVEEVE